MDKVNGVELDIAGKAVAEYIATTNYDPKRIAVERNGEIVFQIAVRCDRFKRRRLLGSSQFCGRRLIDSFKK